MTILSTRATPITAALCLVFAAPAANAAGFMYFKDSPIVGEMPDSRKLAAPTQPRASDGDVDGRDFLIWQRNVGQGASPKAARPGAPRAQTPGALKLK